jgi:hypothetical protein
MVEVGDLLAGVEVLQQRRAALADRQCIVGVVDAHTLLSGQIPGAPVNPGSVELLAFGIFTGAHGGSSPPRDVETRQPLGYPWAMAANVTA